MGALAVAELDPFSDARLRFRSGLRGVLGDTLVFRCAVLRFRRLQSRSTKMSSSGAWGGRKVGSIKTGFNAAVKRARIEHCTPHDLRRTVGRLMVEAGVPIAEVTHYLGRSNPSVARSTYVQLSPQ